MSVAEALPVLTRRERERSRECWTGCRAAELSGAQLTAAKAAGYEPGPDGWLVGRDPRAMSAADFAVMGHERMSPIEAIRAKCLDCCAGSPHEVRLCVATSCPSWPFRTGSNPYRTVSEGRREQGRRLAAQRAARAAEPKSDLGLSAGVSGVAPGGAAAGFVTEPGGD